MHRFQRPGPLPPSPEPANFTVAGSGHLWNTLAVMDVQSIRFTEVAGRRVAYASVGSGPPLVMGGWWMSHLEGDWRNRRFRSFLGAIGRYRTVVRYDRPGTGLSSDGEGALESLGQEVAVLDGVIDALGLERVDVFAASTGGPVAMALAAERPEQIGRLVLYGTYADGSRVADPEARESILGVVRSHWGLGSRVLSDVFLPTADGAERAEFAAFQREVASPELAAQSLASVYSFDVSDRLGSIRAPVTVLHRRDVTAIPVHLGLELAAAIPDASFTELEGSDHFPWRGRADEVAREILGALGVEGPEVEITEGGPAPAAAEAVDSELSPRELEVLRLIALGRADRENAAELGLSPHTVHRHVANIRNKLRLPSRAAAAAHAARLGLLD
jgi:pimeloyl-ACP methyl ester carboxylesterase/DNA-binding CsgD family transcriptional regulator